MQFCSWNGPRQGVYVCVQKWSTWVCVCVCVQYFYSIYQSHGLCVSEIIAQWWEWRFQSPHNFILIQIIWRSLRVNNFGMETADLECALGSCESCRNFTDFTWWFLVWLIVKCVLDTVPMIKLANVWKGVYVDVWLICWIIPRIRPANVLNGVSPL